MNIDNLAPELKQLLIKRNKEQNKEGQLAHHTDVSALIVWSDTPEGHDFWHLVDKGADVTGWACYPKPIESYQIF